MTLRFGCGKKNLLNHHKASQFFEYDCLQSFLLLFMSLLTTLIVKNSYIFPGVDIIFLENVLHHTWNTFNTEFGCPEVL